MHGGIHAVHSRIDLDVLTDELRENFRDINKDMSLRARILAIHQRTSVQAYTTLFRHL